MVWLSCKEQHQPVSFSMPDDFAKGVTFYTVNNDSAFYYFNRVLTGSADSLQIAAAYTYMGIIQSLEGDYFGSQESLLSSLKHLDENSISDSAYLFSNFNELGRVTLNLKNYDAAVEYYDKALSLTKNPTLKIIALSNKAVVYQKEKQYQQAVAIYDSILDKTTTDVKRYARLLSNMAFTKWLQDSVYKAVPAMKKALEIQQNEKDNWGMNASFAHLSDYYFNRRPDTALYFAKKMYAVAQLLGSPDDELEALQKVISLAQADSVKQYFTRYQYLNDSLQTRRNNAKNQFALIRYEIAKSKADNLSLQKDNAEKKFQIILLLATLTTLIIAAIFIYQWLKKRRQQLLHQQQLKTSQKVHDVVANGLYHLMAKIQYEEPGEEIILDDLEVLYEQSRNISYDRQEEILGNYADLIAAMLSSFSTTNTSVSIVGNDETVWYDASVKIKNELHYVLREIMVNMKKHAEASTVVIRFERNNNVMQIFYTDDGKGFPANFEYKNGLRNTENRMAAVGGNISFDTSVPKGLKIQISIPIS